MPPLMVCEVALSRKPLPTAFKRAEVGLLPSVGSYMGFKIPLFSKALPAAFKGTFEWFFASMGTLVHYQA